MPAALHISRMFRLCCRPQAAWLAARDLAGCLARKNNYSTSVWRARPAAVGGVHRPAKVGNLQLALHAQQQVLGLDIPVDDVLRVAVQQRARQRSNVPAPARTESVQNDFAVCAKRDWP